MTNSNPFADPEFGKDPGAAPAKANPFSDPEFGKEPKRSWGEAAADVGVGLLQGGAGLVKSAGDLYGVASGDMDNAASTLGQGGQEHWQEKKSDALQAKERQRKANIDAQDSTLGKAWSAVKDTVTDPALAVDTVATNVGTLLPSMAAGRGVAAWRLAQGARAAEAAGLSGEAAHAAAQAVAKSAGTAGTAAAIGAGALQQAADVSSGGYDEALKKPEAVWDVNPQFQALLAANGGDRAAAKHQIALASARASFGPAAAVSVASNAIPGATYLERALVGGGALKAAKAGSKYAIPRAIAKSALGEAGQEFVEEGGGQLAANVANRHYVDPNQDLTQDVGENAGMGAAGGFLLGAGGGAFHGHAEHGHQVQGDTHLPAPGEQAAGEPGANATPTSETPRPSEVLGLDPAAGPLSDAAALAVDSGAAGQLAQAAQAQTEEQAQGASHPAQGMLQGAAVDADGVIEPAPQQALQPHVYPTYEEAHAYAMGQRRNGANVHALPVPVDGGFALAMKGTPEYEQGVALRAQRQQAETQTKNAEQQPAPAAATTANDAIESAASEPADINAVIAKQIPDMTDAELRQAAEHYGPGHKRTAKIEKEINRRALASKLAPDTPVSPETPAIQGAQNGPQADQTQQASPQPAPPGAAPAAKPGLTEAGAQWARMGVAERKALAARTDMAPVLRKNLHGAQWENLSADVQGKLADLMPPPAPARINPDEDEHAPQWTNSTYDSITKGEVGKGYRLIGKNPDGAEVYEAGGVRKVKQGEYVVSEVAHKPKESRTAEWRTTEELGRARPDGNPPPPDAPAQAVTDAAHQAATSPRNDLPAPSDAQKEAGNYKKGHVNVNGHDISIENPAGTRRNPAWPALKNHYGYIKGTMGHDKDHVDVFLTDHAHDASLPVFVVDQNHKDGRFDEHKVIMGAPDEAQARKTYLDNYAKGWKGLAAITRMTQDEFKAWVRDPAKTSQRAASGNLTTTPEQQREAYKKAEALRTASGNRLRADAWEKNPFRAFLGKHGVALDQAREFAPGKTERGKAMVQGYGPIFRRRGKQLDMLAQAAVEDGFLIAPDVAKLHAMIADALNGRRIIPQFAESVAEQEMQGKIEHHAQLEQDAALDDNTEVEADARAEREAIQEVSALSDAEAFTLADDDIALVASSNASTADFLRALGASEQEIADAIAKEQGKPREDHQGRPGAQEAATGPAPGDSGQRAAASRPGPSDQGLIEPAPFEAQQQEFESRGQRWRITVGRYWKVPVLKQFDPDALSWSAEQQKSIRNGVPYWEAVRGDDVPQAVAKLASEFFNRVSQPAPADDLLTAPTREDVLAQQEHAEQAEKDKAKADADAEKAAKAAADQKEVDARQQASAENFQLGQSAEDALSGQADIFSAPQAEADAPAPSPEPARPFTHINGDRAEYTGKSVNLHGGLFYEVEFTEGAKKGQQAVTQRAPDGTNPGQNATPPASGIVTPQIVPVKTPARQTKAERERAEHLSKLADYFAPGNVVKGYSGFDEVLAYTPPTDGKNWSVKVHEVKKEGGQWVRIGKPQDARSHSTEPDARNLAAGPVDKMPQAEAKPAAKTPSAQELRARADLNNALADLGDIFNKPFKANIMPEQEQKLLPVLTRVLDAAFRLGYVKFKDAAKFALNQIRAALGADVADALSLDHLQGAYIAMAGGKPGVDSKRAVINIEDKAEIESHTLVEPGAKVEPKAAVEPKRAKPEPKAEAKIGDVVGKYPSVEGTEIHIVKSDNGYTVAMKDTDIAQYLPTLRWFKGDDALAQAKEYAESIQKRADPVGSAASLADHLYTAIQADDMPRDNPALRKLVEAFDGKPADNARLKQAQEALEAAIARSARDVVGKSEGHQATFEALVRLYESQPNLNIRTSTSMANQAYSTPAPLAYLASRLAGITRKDAVLEPTGGTGMLLIEADPKKAAVNELNPERAALLRAQGFTVTEKDAAAQTLTGAKVDAVITNPPFGSVKNARGEPIKVDVDGYRIGQIDHLIAARALQEMKDDGRATLILGANKVEGGRSNDDLIFFNWLYGHYNVTGHFEVNGDLYNRQGAGWPVRVISINGRQTSGRVAPLAGTVQRADNWSQVYEHFTTSLATSGQPTHIEPAPGAGGAGTRQAEPGRVPGLAGAENPGADRGRPEGRHERDRDAARGAGDRGEHADKPVAAGVDPQRLNGESVEPDRLEPVGSPAPHGADKPARADGANALADADNQFQAPYVPRSARKDEGVLIPVNMAGPTQDALSKLEDAVGDIDKFAAKELGYASTDELHDALMGLQVDSVASAIHQIKNGKGVVIADQTGIGKGRQAAAIIRWAARNGHIPVFMSQKPSLFTDMHGDLADIDTHDVAPFIMNAGAWISGPAGEKLFASRAVGQKALLERIRDTGELPAGSNALFTTYSQISMDNVQRQMLAALAHRAIFILDESHTAGGDSATGKFVTGLLEGAKGVTYLSATYAKRPDNMPLYFKTDIGQVAADNEGLMSAMSAGGLPLQTVVSNNLVKAGQMFRRERSYNGVNIESLTDRENREAHENLSDATTSALRAIVDADAQFHTGFVKQMKDEAAAAGEAIHDIAGNQASESVNHTEFSSVVHNFVRQMLLGLKAQPAADAVIATLKAGRKPIIAVENTMGSFLNEYAVANGVQHGTSLGDFGYRTVLSRALERTRAIVRQLPNGVKVREEIPLSRLDAATRAAYQHAQSVIDGLKLDIPVSPIDWMRAQIQRAGYSVAEITGRNLSVDYGDAARPMLSTLDAAEQNDKVRTTRLFNAGRLDALILNVAGSTGISLHASDKFTDQRQRHMIVAQPAQDINTFMQMLGRIHRTGQVVLPRYTLLSVDLPTEKRPTALLSKKMKSLNANTSSNTESATSVKTADMLNKYGDQVVGQYLSDNYALSTALGIEGPMTDNGPMEDVARKATGRLALQPIKVQQAFYDEVEGQYNALMDYLNQTNQNDLEPRTFDFDAKELRQEVLFEGADPSTPFGEDAIYGEYSIKAQGRAMTPAQIKAIVAEHLDGASGEAHAKAIADRLNAQFNAYRSSLPEGAAQENADRQQGRGMAFIEAHPIGSTFRVDINGDALNAIVTNLRSTHKSAGNPFSMSKLQVSLALNGALRNVTVPATQFQQIEVSPIARGYSVEQLFKEQPADQRETAKIITGNLLAAYGELSGVRGTIISFTKSDGSTEQGILLPKLFDFTKNTRGDYRLATSADALAFLQKSENPDIDRFGIMSRDSVVRVTPNGSGISVTVPKSKLKGGKYYLDKDLIAALGDFVSKGSSMIARVTNAPSAIKALDVLMNKQALYALPSMADEAKTLTGNQRESGAPTAKESGAQYDEAHGRLNEPTQPDGGTDRPIRSAAVSSVRGGEAGVQRRTNIIGLGIAADIERAGSTALVGREVTGPDQLAELAQVYRDPRYETFRVFFTKDGKIVHSTGVSARLPGQTPMVPAGMSTEQYIAQFKDNMAQTGADGYYILHNHPSGNPMPSDADVSLTKYLSAQVPGMVSHVVINSNKYAVIAQDGKAQRVETRDFGPNLLLQASKPLAALGHTLLGSDDLARIGKSMQRPGWVTLVGVGSDNKVRMVSEAPSSILTRASLYLTGMVRRLQRQSGSSLMFAIGQDGDIHTKAIVSAVRSGILTDALPANGQSLVGQGLGREPSPFDKTQGRVVREDAPVYSAAGKSAAINKVLDTVNSRIFAPGKVSWWHKSFGTMYNLAERAPAFKPVFEAAQNFINDVSYYAAEAADLAPRILPKLETWRDIGKKPIAAPDNKAISAPIFEGTLSWGRDERGNVSRMEDLEARYAGLSSEDKAGMLLRKRVVTEDQLKRWQASPLDIYEGAVRNRFKSAFLEPGVVFTDAELRSHFNLTPEQISLYREFRAATDQSLDNMAKADMLRFGGDDVAPLREQVMEAKDATEAANLLNEYLKSLAQEEPNREKQLSETIFGLGERADKAAQLKANGYAPLSRFGRYTVDVVQGGERQYFSLFETAHDANQMAARMRMEFGADSVTQGTLSNEAFKMFAGVTPETLELFGNALGLDSTGDKARDQVFQDYLKLTKTNRSAMRRLIHRKGIAGYSEDAGRVLASFVYSNSLQTAAALHMGDLGRAVTDIPQAQGELTDVAVRLAEYIKNPQEEAQAVRGLLFAQYLGGSVASSFVNMMQPIQVSIPYLSQFGGAVQSGRQLMRAYADIAKKTAFDPDLVKALKHAEENGIVSPQEVHQLMAQARGAGSLKVGDGTRAGNAMAAGSNALSRLSLAWGKVFGVAEQLNRRSTFIAAFRIAQAQKIANPAQFAEKAVNETQFIYNKANKMQFGRGAIGGTLMTFKSYTISYLELMHRMYTQGGPQGKKAALLGIGMLFLMGGASGLPFEEDIENLADGLLQRLGYNVSSKKAKQEFLEGIFGAAGAEFVDRGLSGLPGVPIDVSGRLGLGNIIPGTGLAQQKSDHTSDILEVAGPMGDFVKRLAQAGGSLLGGDLKNAALSAAPNAVRNAAKGVDMAATGMYRDAKGYKVLETNPLEAAFKALGFQPGSVAEVQGANSINQQAKNFYNLTAQNIRAQWARGIAEDNQAMVDSARAAVATWNRQNPAQPMVISVPSVMKRVQEMRKSKDQRIADTAPKAMRARMREELVRAHAGL